MSAVYKRELRAFFTSPIGYVFIAAFLAVMNITFYVNNVIGYSADISYLFAMMLAVLMVLAPVLTMRVFAEEFKMKTDQLLLTSPAGVWGVVLGKFFAAFSVYVVALIGTLAWSVVIARNAVPNTLTTVGCYVGVLFAGAAFMALGIFLSSLTESQVIAAISSFAVFFVIFLLNSFANSINIRWIRMLINWFSLFSRYDNFAGGLFSLADVVFYLSFAFVFLFLATRVIEKKRWS